MARKKRKVWRQGWFSKLLNIGIILLGFSRPIELLFSGQWKSIISESTFGLSESSAGHINLDLGAGFRFYAPAGAAAGLGFLKSYLMRRFPVRR